MKSLITIIKLHCLLQEWLGQVLFNRSAGSKLIARCNLPKPSSGSMHIHPCTLLSLISFYNGKIQNLIRIKTREKEACIYISFEVWLDRIGKLNGLGIGQGLVSWRQSVIRQWHESVCCPLRPCSETYPFKSATLKKGHCSVFLKNSIS